MFPPPSEGPALQHAPAAVANAPAACAGSLGTCLRGACGHRATAACAHPLVGARQGPAPAARGHHPIVGSAGRLLDFRLTASPESLLLGLVRLSAYTSPGVATALHQSTDASAITERASRRRWCYHRLLAIPASLTSGRTAGSTTRKAQRKLAGSAPGAPGVTAVPGVTSENAALHLRTRTATATVFAGDSNASGSCSLQRRLPASTPKPGSLSRHGYPLNAVATVPCGVLGVRCAGPLTPAVRARGNQDYGAPILPEPTDLLSPSRRRIPGVRERERSA